MDNNEFQARTEQINRLVQRVNALDEDARTTALELLQSLMDLHGAATVRLVEVLAESGEHGRKSLARLSEDPLICGLLVLYGVHPVPFEERVKNAIERARPRVTKQGGTVELLGTNDGVVRIKIESSGHGCHSSPDALKDVVEQAILEAAPEVVEIVAEGAAAADFVPLGMIQPATREEKCYEKSTA